MTGSKRKASDKTTTATPAKLRKTSAVPNTTDLSPEDVVAGMSSPDLRKIVVGLLSDEVAGPIVKTSLLSPTNIDVFSAHPRVEAEREYQKIIDGAKAAIYSVYNKAMDMKGMQSSGAWPRALERFLPLIKALLNRDPSTGGAVLAWKAALEVGRLCNLPPDGSECRIQEGEEECDTFHDEMDNLMVEVCKVQQSRGQIAWLKDGRVEEVIDLAKSPSWNIYGGKHHGKHPGDYRYKKVVKFLGKL